MAINHRMGEWRDRAWSWACESIHDARTWFMPEYLHKACWDYFDYAIGLRDGTVIRCAEARYDRPGWIFLADIESVTKNGNRIDFSFERGMAVRLSEIQWVADAPCGS